ncbi:MAG: SMC-Scp complex subunit ScpB [Eubacterium sp.]|nr:SMC-Scp complex subunit ScpB [Eubacterium sp.]
MEEQKQLAEQLTDELQTQEQPADELQINEPQPEEKRQRPEGWTEAGAIEAILFSAGDPVSLDRLAAVTGSTPAAAKHVLQCMQERYASNESGIMLLELENSWQLCTKQQYFDTLIQIASHPPKPHLTEVVMETLSIIAYKQPVTKAEIERIRGVKSDHAVNKLVEYDLVREVGRLDAPGRPILFGTTDQFLRNFGISSSGDLPELSAVEKEDFRAEAEAELAAGETAANAEQIRVEV